MQQELNNNDSESIQRLAQNLDPQITQLHYEIALNSLSKFSVHPHPKQALELCILRMLAFQPIGDLATPQEEKKNPKITSVPAVEIKQECIEEPTPKIIQTAADIEQLEKTVIESSPSSLDITSWNSMFHSLELSMFVKQVFSEIGDQIACIIFEPVVGNMNCVPPVEGFLECLRECCTNSGALLIADEVMTGFRISQTGAVGHYNLDADLICLGKVIGGGMPVGAFGGKREIMEYIAPLGPVYQAGTLSGNPVAMAAGLKTLELVSAEGFLDPVIERTDRLVKGLVERATQAGIPMTSNHVGTMWGFFFSEEEKITHYQQVMECDTERFAKFFHHMLDEGVYLAPASYEASFMSAAHTEDDIQFTLDAAERSFKKL